MTADQLADLLYIMDFLKPVLLDSTLPEGSIVDLCAWDEEAGALIVAAVVRLN
jgi:hypothetical protein